MARSFWRDISCLFLTLVCAPFSLAGGPAYVAGASYFDASAKGTPLTWDQGSVTYYTDRGDLGPALPHAAADAFVADAFGRWTNIATAAVTVAPGGQLSEDVSGVNVFLNSDRTISMPLDILPAATATPVGVVYDADGSVTDALMGQGASAAEYCYLAGAFGGPDNFSTDAHIVHALVVLNGHCAQSSSQLPDLKYRLIRTLGQVLGLGWTQTNLNVNTGTPRATAADYAGFSVMHDHDDHFCMPISNCYPNADQPKLDDEAALSRLYPVTTQNQANFRDKTLFRENTVGIHGSVYFSNASGNPAQPMQGVNVVARWIDPASGLPSRTYVATSVSGFLFRGNAGNPATGFADMNGRRYDRFGSDDAALEGFFDLAGLKIPNGAQTGQFQLTVENVDELMSYRVGPYAPSQVKMSGTAQPIILTASVGSDLQQDILMQGAATSKPDPYPLTAYGSPAVLPAVGEWTGSISGYGDVDYLWFSGQGDRTLTVEVTALDESGAVSQTKLLPIIGMWGLSDPGTFPAPARTSSAFNSPKVGTSRLNASLLGASAFRLGIGDQRGDGRPDYRYRARVFYGDNLSNGRASVAGGSILTVRGYGFRSSTAVSIAGGRATLLASSPTQLLVRTPPHADGTQDIALSDPDPGISSNMSTVLTYGAGPNDRIVIVSAANSSVPVGGQAGNPIIVRVVGPDGATPVQGASVAFSSVPAASLSVCMGIAACTVLTDQSGLASTFVVPLTAGVTTITAQLAPASYSTPKQVQAVVLAAASSLDLSLSKSSFYIAQGAAIDVPITARALSNGTPMAGQTVTFSVTTGPGSFANTTVSTDASGYTANLLHLSGITSQVSGNACVTAGGRTACQSFNAFPVPSANLQLQAIDGGTQTVKVGTTFQPISVRVVDTSTPPYAIMGASVMFQSVIGRAQDNAPILWIGSNPIRRNPMPIILSSSQVSVTSDASGVATMQPNLAGVQGPVLVLGTAKAGPASFPYQLQSLP